MQVYWGFKLVGRVGFEPTTNGLKGRCSTTELPTHPIGAGTLNDAHRWRKREFARRPQKAPSLTLATERQTPATRARAWTPIRADREIGTLSFQALGRWPYQHARRNKIAARLGIEFFPV